MKLIKKSIKKENRIKMGNTFNNSQNKTSQLNKFNQQSNQSNKPITELNKKKVFKKKIEKNIENKSPKK